MEKVTLVGAGGKMGMRITNNLYDYKDYEMTYLEVSEKGIQWLKEKGLTPSDPEKVVPETDFLILAVPDVLIERISHQYIPLMKPGAMAVCLDPAAPLAGALPDRKDLSYFASHPSHPSVFNWEPDETAHFDYFGGIAAKQTIVCALFNGPDEDYSKGENLAKTMYKPVVKSHRIELEHMGILEPALSETFCGAMITRMKEAVDIVVEKGVPKEAAYDFFLGHINIELALLFGQLPGGQFSDAAKKAIDMGMPLLFKDDWKKIFEWDHVVQQIKAIT